jgi:hypothetical protein
MENTPRSQTKKLKYNQKNLGADDLFEVFGYYKEYTIDGKLIGIKDCEKPKDSLFGYYSRKDFIAENNIILKKGKVIKKGQEYYTRVYPFCGKMKKKHKLTFNK